MAQSDLEAFLDQRAAKKAASPEAGRRTLPPISDYVADVDRDHNGKSIFTLRALRGGQPSTSFASDLTIWLDRGPEGLIAFRNALPRIAAAADAALKLLGVQQAAAAQPPAAPTPPPPPAQPTDPFASLPF